MRRLLKPTAATPVVAEGIEFREYEVRYTVGEDGLAGPVIRHLWQTEDGRLVVGQNVGRETWFSRVGDKRISNRARSRETAMFSAIRAAR